MLDVLKVGELDLIVSDGLLSYVPLCGDTGGFVTEEAGRDSSLREFDFSVAKFTSEILTIPPYFYNKKFCVMYGACLNKSVIDSYGGDTTELSYIKFTGESLDNLTALLQRIKKEMFIEAKKAKADVNDLMNAFFEVNILRVTFEQKRNSRGNKYYAGLFQSVPSKYPKFSEGIRNIDVPVTENVMRVRSINNTSQLSFSASPSSSASPSYRDDTGRDYSLPANSSEDYGF